MRSGADQKVDDNNLDFFVKAALFLHVGVNDPDDWRAVVISLAARYAPEVLQGTSFDPRRKKGGRPEILSDSELWWLAPVVESTKHKRGLKTIEAACQFILSSPEAEHIREIFKLKPNLSVGRLRNMVTASRKLS